MSHSLADTDVVRDPEDGSARPIPEHCEDVLLTGAVSESFEPTGW